MLKSLPVLMYHYISSWPDPMSVAPEIFESHLEAMTEAGYRGISLAEAEAYLRDGQELPAKSVLITFDDGFLDNYVNAWPLLEKHGHHGTVFTVTDKITSLNNIRPCLKDVWNEYVKAEDLPMVNRPFHKTKEGLRVRTDSFISWNEMKAMADSGVMSFAAHTHTHQQIFTGPKIHGLFRPGHKHRTFDQFVHDTPYGLPYFDWGSGMASKAYLPSPRVYEEIKSEIPQDFDGAYRYFNMPGNKTKWLDKWKATPPEELGTLETDEQFRERVHKDLSSCREAYISNMGNQPASLAWPWGEYSDVALEIARELGFDVFFTTATGANPPSEPLQVHRFKVRNKGPKWLLSRLWAYSRPLAAKTYSLFRR